MKRLLLLGLLFLSIGNGALIELIQRMSMLTPAGTMAALTGRSLAGPLPVQLTTGGCCTQPFWSPDGKEVRYIDKPAGGQLGIYAIPLGTPSASSAAAPTLVSTRVEDSRIAGPYRVETTRTTTTLVRLSDGKKFAVPAQGRSVQFSPDFKRIAWSISNPDLPPERQVTVIWIANADGTGAQRLATVQRGGVSGWISNAALLVNGQDPKDRAVQILWSLSVADSKLTELVRVERLRSAVLSPSGRWVAYYTAFSAQGPNGLWIVDTAGGKPKAAPKEAFGSYQWRRGTGGDQLVVVPFRPETQYHEFWQLDAQSMAFTQLTRVDDAPLKIANGDWRLSPDGRYAAYVESKDHNIWVVNLP